MSDPLTWPRIQRFMSEEEEWRMIQSIFRQLTEDFPVPHDSNGIELKLGDEVLIRAIVTQLGQEPLYCNCTVALKIKMPGSNAGQVITISQLNTKQVEKVGHGE